MCLKGGRIEVKAQPDHIVSVWPLWWCQIQLQVYLQPLKTPILICTNVPCYWSSFVPHQQCRKIKKKQYLHYGDCYRFNYVTIVNTNSLWMWVHTYISCSALGIYIYCKLVICFFTFISTYIAFNLYKQNHRINMQNLKGKGKFLVFKYHWTDFACRERLV